MVTRNGKSMLKLVTLLILKPLFLKREILWYFESSKNLKDSAGWRGCYQEHIRYILLLLPNIYRRSQWGCSFDGGRLNFVDFDS